MLHISVNINEQAAQAVARLARSETPQSPSAHACPTAAQTVSQDSYGVPSHHPAYGAGVAGDGLRVVMRGGIWARARARVQCCFPEQHRLCHACSALAQQLVAEVFEAKVEELLELERELAQ